MVCIFSFNNRFYKDIYAYMQDMNLVPFLEDGQVMCRSLVITLYKYKCDRWPGFHTLNVKHVGQCVISYSNTSACVSVTDER